MSSDTGSHGSLDAIPEALLRAVRSEIPEAIGAQEVELFFTRNERVHAEHEPATAQHVHARGVTDEVHARVWREGQVGRASLPYAGGFSVGVSLSNPASIRSFRDVIAAAATATKTEPWSLPGEAPEGGSDLTLSPERLEESCRRLGEALHLRGRPVQAFFARQSLTRTLLARRSGLTGGWSEGFEELMIRVETPGGAVMQAMGAPLPAGLTDAEVLLERLEVACAPLERKERSALEPLAAKLPAVLASEVSSQLLAAFAPLLRADVAAQTLAAHQGKKLFASCVSVRDEPLHERGLVRRSFDDEGARLASAELVSEGRLLGFLHAAPQLPPGVAGAPARALRQRGGVIPGWSNLLLLPAATPLSLPPDRLEVTSCVETFSPRPRPGRLDLLVAGWQVRDGKRVSSFGPVALEGPVLALLRRIQAVGDELRFHPTADGCGAPPVLLSTLF